MATTKSSSVQKQSLQAQTAKADDRAFAEQGKPSERWCVRRSGLTEQTQLSNIQFFNTLSNPSTHITWRGAAQPGLRCQAQLIGVTRPGELWLHVVMKTIHVRPTLFGLPTPRTHGFRDSRSEARRARLVERESWCHEPAIQSVRDALEMAGLSSSRLEGLPKAGRLIKPKLLGNIYHSSLSQLTSMSAEGNLVATVLLGSDGLCAVAATGLLRRLLQRVKMDEAFIDLLLEFRAQATQPSQGHPRFCNTATSEFGLEVRAIAFALEAGLSLCTSTPCGIQAMVNIHWAAESVDQIECQRLDASRVGGVIQRCARGQRASS